MKRLIDALEKADTAMQVMTRTKDRIKIRTALKELWMLKTMRENFTVARTAMHDEYEERISKGENIRYSMCKTYPQFEEARTQLNEIRNRFLT